MCDTTLHVKDLLVSTRFLWLRQDLPQLEGYIPPTGSLPPYPSALPSHLPPGAKRLPLERGPPALTKSNDFNSAEFCNLEILQRILKYIV